MRFRSLWRLVVPILVLVALMGCGASSPAATPTQQTSESGGEMIVFAASSLKESFDLMARNLKSNGLDKVSYNYGGSQVLASQLAQGAQADVYASADAKNMQVAVDAGAVASGTQRLMATNKLAVIAYPGAKVTSLNDLARPGLKLVLADPSVPAGNYSLQVLDKLAADLTYGKDFKAKVLANVVSRENNVRQVFSKVQLGEADAVIVYVTDIRATSEQIAGNVMRPLKLGVVMVDIPDQYNVIAKYYIAPVKGAPHPQAASKFIDYVLSDDGQRVLDGFGFGRADRSK